MSTTIPRRARIVGALSQWIDKGSLSGRLQSVKLVHCRERGDRKVDDWPITWDGQGKCAVRVGELATIIETTAVEHAANLGGDAIQESYEMVPYFGEHMAEGGVCNFRCDAALARADEGGDPVGSFTEGATPRGIIHQGMRHHEVMAKTYGDLINTAVGEVKALFAEVRAMFAEVCKDRRELMDKNKEMREEVEDAKDRGVERQLAVYRAYEEEKRTTKFLELLQAVAPDLLGMALGRPLLPQNSTNQTINALKHGVRSLSVDQVNAICGIVDPPLAMMVMQMKKEVIEEDEAEERKKQQEATREVQGQIQNGVIQDEKALGAVSKRSEVTVQPGGST